jgi:hypothetical protein
VDSVPDPLLLIKSGSAGNRTRTSGSVARNTDHRGAHKRFLIQTIQQPLLHTLGKRYASSNNKTIYYYYSISLDVYLDEEEESHGPGFTWAHLMRESGRPGREKSKTLKWLLWNKILSMEVDGTGSGSCPVAGSAISGVEPSGSATRLS